MAQVSEARVTCSCMPSFATTSRIVIEPVVRNVSMMIRNVSMMIRNVSMMIRNVSMMIRNVSIMSADESPDDDP